MEHLKLIKILAKEEEMQVGYSRLLKEMGSSHSAERRLREGKTLCSKSSWVAAAQELLCHF